MASLHFDRSVRSSAILAFGLLALGVVSARAAELRTKEQPWPTQDEAPAAATGCEYLGKGYMKAPGSDTCVRMSGYVRSELSVIGR